MSYASLTGTEEFEHDCASDQIWSEDAGACVEHICSGNRAPYYGECLTLEEQARIGETMCAPYGEVYYAGVAACFCPPGKVRNQAGTCVYESQLAPGEAAGPAARTVAEAAAGAPAGLKLVAIGAALAGAGFLAWHYYGGG